VGEKGKGKGRKGGVTGGEGKEVEGPAPIFVPRTAPVYLHDPKRSVA